MNEQELEFRAHREYLLIKQEILQQQLRVLQQEWVEAEARFGRPMGPGLLPLQQDALPGE